MKLNFYIPVLLSALIFACLWALISPSLVTHAVVASSILTAQDSCTEPLAGQVTVQGSTWKAQTFSPSRDYALSFVDLAGTNRGGTTTLHIKQASNGQPSGPDLAAVSITSGNTFILTKPLPLSTGTLYALVLSNEDGNYSWGYSDSSTCYSNPIGHPYTSLDSGSSWSSDSVDFNFVIYDTTSTPQPTAVVPTATPRPPSNPVTKPTVFVISFPFETPMYNPQQLTDTLVDRLEDASRYHGYSDPTARSFLRFQLYGGAIVAASTTPPMLANGNYDVGWIYSQYKLCDLVQSGAVDEVWLWDAGQGGFPEWMVTGPEWTQAGDYHLPNCGKQVTTMVFNYNRQIDSALHSFNHRLEGLGSHYFPCDLFTETWPWVGWPSECAGLVSDQYGFVARPGQNNSYIGVCGDVHHPPNITDAQDYDYDSMTTVQSICEDWRQDGKAIVRSINCQSWGCTEEGFQIWWMQNLPGYNNTNLDRNGQPMRNWLAYLFGTPQQPQAPQPHLFLPLMIS